MKQVIFFSLILFVLLSCSSKDNAIIPDLNSGFGISVKIPLDQIDPTDTILIVKGQCLFADSGDTAFFSELKLTFAQSLKHNREIGISPCLYVIGPDTLDSDSGYILLPCLKLLIPDTSDTSGLKKDSLDVLSLKDSILTLRFITFNSDTSIHDSLQLYWEGFLDSNNNTMEKDSITVRW